MPFSAWLLFIPPWISSILIVGFFTAFGIGVTLLVRRFVHHSVLEQHNDIAGFVYATIGVIYGVMLAFVMFVVWEQYNDASMTAENEAMHAHALYRDLMLYPDIKEAGPALASLSLFSHSVVEKEYPALKSFKWGTEREASIETRDKFANLWADIKKIAPHTMQEQSLFAEILQDINIIGQSREQRLLMARSDLAGVIWGAVVLGAMITIGFTGFFGTENFKAHLFIVGLLGLITGLVIYTIVNLNYPFMGVVSIGPDGYKYLIDLANWR